MNDDSWLVRALYMFAGYNIVSFFFTWDWGYAFTGVVLFGLSIAKEKEKKEPEEVKGID